MSEIVPFDFGTQRVRVVMIDSEPWWVAADVCAVLSIGNTSAALSRLDPEGVSQTETLTPGGHQRLNVVSEPALYELIFRSDKPAAKDFRRWVTSKVLPQIRRTGGYQMAPQNYAEALRAAADAWEESERQKRLAIEAKAYADELEPKAEEYDAYLDSDGLYTLAETAQLLRNAAGVPMGRQRLVDRLRDLEILCQPASFEGPRPFQKYLEKDWFELRPTQYQQGRRMRSYMQTFVTPKGISSIYRALVADGEDLIEPQL